MEEDISPKYLMNLLDQIEDKIWSDYNSYKKVRNYITKWHINNWEFNNFYEENFSIYNQNDDKSIDLNRTLHWIEWNLVIKMAIDLWIETPGFIPLISEFRNDLKDNYSTAFWSFEKAFKEVENDPSISIGLANSTLESIIKHILNDENIETKLDRRKTLYKLTEDILKEFSLFPSKDDHSEIKLIWSWLLKACQSIENLRSSKTSFHWRAADDYIMEDSMYWYFIINSVSTIWKFLIHFYNNNYNTVDTSTFKTDNDISVEDIPF